MARVVFFGSPDFALPSLEILLPTEYRPVLVVTQPDRPSGRGKKLTPTPIRKFAEENGIAVKVLKDFDEQHSIEELRSVQPDFFVVVAFGLIFPPPALQIVKQGNVNVHASLLPAYRGASPVNMAIVSGDSFTGVTTMEMVKSLDTGPIYLQGIVPIDPMEDAGELSKKLSKEGARLLLDTLKGIDSGRLKPVQQPDTGVSHAPRLSKKDGLIKWEMDAISIHNQIRGMNPWPGSYTYYNGNYLKILRSEPYDLIPRSDPPGLIVEITSTGIRVSCGKGTLQLKRLQAEGRRPLEFSEFVKGYPIEPGNVLEKESR